MTKPQVFISKPTVLTPGQESAFRNWIARLSGLGFESTALEREHYAPAPWTQLRDVLLSVDGMLVLGFRQMSVSTGHWRPGTEEAASSAGWYPSPWNQLEAGLAVMARIPVLVAPEGGISDGVFSTDVWTGVVYGLTVDHRLNPESESSRERLDAWADAVRRRSASEHVSRSG
jgi:hypothetical protein